MSKTSFWFVMGLKWQWAPNFSTLTSVRNIAVQLSQTSAS